MTMPTKELSTKSSQRPPNTRPKKLKSCLSVSQHDTTTRPPALKKSVSFHQVEIREYERIVGDNPSVSSGPAVSLAWDHHDKMSLQLNDYESIRPPRRCAGEFQMPTAVRRSLLMQSGATHEELYRSEREIKKVQRRRQATQAMQECEGAQILLQSIGRKWNRFRKGVSTQQEQENLWKDAYSSYSDKETKAVEEMSMVETEQEKVMDDTDETEQGC
jgi:hypothetical protein